MADNITYNIEHYFGRGEAEILLSYKGPFEKVILRTLAQYIGSLVDEKNIQRKLLKIFVELADHVYKSTSTANADDVEGAISLLKFQNYYVLSTGHIVKSTQITEIESSINHINSLDLEGLRQYKRDLLSKYDSVETNLVGLIKVALTAEHKIEFQQKKLDSTTMLVTIKVILDSTN